MIIGGGLTLADCPALLAMGACPSSFVVAPSTTTAGTPLTVVILKVVWSLPSPKVIGLPEASVVPWRTKSPFEALVNAKGAALELPATSGIVVVLPTVMKVLELDVSILNVTGPCSPVRVIGDPGARVRPPTTYRLLLFNFTLTGSTLLDVALLERSNDASGTASVVVPPYTINVLPLCLRTLTTVAWGPLLSVSSSPGCMV